MNMSYTYGIFRQAQGRFMLDRTNPAGCKFQIDDRREQHRHQPAGSRHASQEPRSFFNVAQFPSITFDSTSVTQGGSQQGVVYQVTGN